MFSSRNQALILAKRFIHFRLELKGLVGDPFGEQGWHSGESALLPPMCPGFDSCSQCHMWVEFVVGSLTWGPFLERPGNLPGPESDFDIKVSRKVWCVLTSDEVHFVSLADNFTVQLSNFLKLPLEWKTKQLNGPGNYRELRETGP